MITKHIKAMITTFKKAAAILSAVLLTASAYAQPGGQMQQVPSTIVHPDNTVTFNYRNENAKDVKVSVQFAGENQMTKGPGGVWTVTLGPAAPDIYPYCFIVDGINVMDPQNPEWFPNETFKNSLLDMRGDSIYQLKDVPHGSVEYVNYWSDAMGMFANAIVYTPPTYYSKPKARYPVMYLISGTTDTEEVYFKVGKMNLILDNLIAEGAAKEMIIVLPYGNPSLVMNERGTSAPANPFEDIFTRDFLESLMPYVDSNYRTIPDAAHRGIGGFSRGGNQGLAIGLTNLDKFSHLCSYSSFTFVRPGMFDNPDDVNSRIKLFWLGVGTDDFLYGNAKDFMDELDSHGINNIKEFTTDKFGHTWMNARYFLDRSFRLLFQD